MTRGFVAAGLIAVAACAPSRENRSTADGAHEAAAGIASDTMEAAAGIDSLEARFLSAYNRDDAAAIAALHTEDIRFISEGTVEEGRTKLEEGWKSSLSSLSGARFTTLGRDIRGDLATMTQRFTQQYKNPTGKIEVDSGYAVEVIRRGADGQWRYQTIVLSRVPLKQ